MSNSRAPDKKSDNQTDLKSCKTSLVFFKAKVDEVCRIGPSFTWNGYGGLSFLHGNPSECKEASIKLLDLTQECISKNRI